MSRAFRLATVERLKEVVLDRAGTELHAAVGRVREAVAERDRLTAELLTDRTPARTTPAHVEVAGHHRELLRDRQLAAAQAVQIAEEELTAAREGWLRARSELRAVQALHERHRRALRAEALRREQRETDDVVGARAARRPPVSLREVALTDLEEVPLPDLQEVPLRAPDVTALCPACPDPSGGDAA